MKSSIKRLPSRKTRKQREEEWLTFLLTERQRRDRKELGYTAYEGRPVEFINEVLREHIWSKQAEIARALVDHPKVAVQSCHGPGKSWIAARIVVWFIASAVPGVARAVTTAPTGDQVKGVLWQEINSAFVKGGDFAGRTTSTEWWIDKFQAAVGRKSADWNPSAFQGWHAQRLLVLLDEACGCSEQLWVAADSLATTEESRILAIGNPDDPASHFAEVCKPGSGWHVIRISAFDSPNFTSEPVHESLKAHLISKFWVEDKRKSWGEQSPLWQSKVLGLFPDVGDETLFPPGWVRKAADRYADGDDSEQNPWDIDLGVDVARFGADETVIGLRLGRRFRIYATLRQRDLMTVCGTVVRAIKDTGCRRCKIDDTGLGGGVTDRLFELQDQGEFGHQQVQIVPINVGGAADDDDRNERSSKDRFLNLRAELHWQLRDAFEHDRIDIENDDDLLGQIVGIRYEMTSNGRIKIEKKDDLKKRGLPSPDRLDALVLAHADHKSRSMRAWESLMEER